MNRTARRLLAASATAILAASCSATTRADRALPSSPFNLAVTMSDDRFVYARRVPPGRVVFAVTNVGRTPHRLALLAPEPDGPPVGAQTQLGVIESIPTLQLMPTLFPGEGSSFAVDLEPRTRYALVSVQTQPDGITDVARGLASELRTQAPPGRPAAGADQP